MNRAVCLVAILCLCAALESAAAGHRRHFTQLTQYGRGQTLQDDNNDDKTKEAQRAYTQAKLKVDTLAPDHHELANRCEKAEKAAGDTQPLSGQAELYAQRTKEVGAAKPKSKKMRDLIARAEDAAAAAKDQATKSIQLKDDICNALKEYENEEEKVIAALDAIADGNPQTGTKLSNERATEIIEAAKEVENKVTLAKGVSQPLLRKTRSWYDLVELALSNAQDLAEEAKDAFELAERVARDPNEKEDEESRNSKSKNGENSAAENSGSRKDNSKSKNGENSAGSKSANNDESNTPSPPDTSNNTDANGTAQAVLTLPTALLFLLIAAATV